MINDHFGNSTRSSRLSELGPPQLQLVFHIFIDLFNFYIHRLSHKVYLYLGLSVTCQLGSSTLFTFTNKSSLASIILAIFPSLCAAIQTSILLNISSTMSLLSKDVLEDLEDDLDK